MNRGHRPRHSPPPPKAIQVAVYNTNRAMGIHLAFLQRCWMEEIDVIMITEPWISKQGNTLTQTHPGYDTFGPAEVWDTKEESRPRVMMYTRRGAGLRTER